MTGPRSPAARRGWALAFFLWLLLTLVLLLTPGSMVGRAMDALAAWLHLPARLDRVPGMGLADKGVHGLLFAGLGFLATGAWLGRGFFRRVMLALLLLGVATELAQHFIPARGASVMDFAAGSLGLLLGFVLARRGLGARQRRALQGR